MAEVAEEMLGAEEGRFGVAVPFDSSQGSHKAFEGGWSLKVLGSLGEAKV
jgi:hypothetical protein